VSLKFAGSKPLLRWFNEANDPETLLQDLQNSYQASSPPAPVKLVANAVRQSSTRKMMENGLMRMVSATIEVLSVSISSYVIISLHSLVQMYKVLLVLAEWCLPNPPLAIVYELVFRAHSNCKIKYLTRYRSNILQNLCYWGQAPSWGDLLLGEW